MPDLPPADIATLPLWGQIGSLMAVIGAVTVAIRKGLLPKEPKTTDTVVVSGAFADGKPIRELVEAIGELRDGQDDVKRETRRMVEELQGIRDDIKRGVSVKIAAGPIP